MLDFWAHWQQSTAFDGHIGSPLTTSVKQYLKVCWRWMCCVHGAAWHLQRSSSSVNPGRIDSRNSIINLIDSKEPIIDYEKIDFYIPTRDL